jgi:multiple sugar transport system substrate-binding protein
MSTSVTRRRAPVRWWGSIMAVVLLASGCTSSNSPSSRRELVWAVPEIERGTAQAIGALWNAGPPGRPKVRIERLPESADDQRRLMAIELNARLPRFDILTLDVIWTGEFAGSGWLAGLEDLRDKWGKRWLAGPLESAMWNGRLWAAPFQSGAGFLYYRTDLVGPTAPATWDELAAAVPEARRKAGGNIAAFVGQGAQYEGLVVNFLEYLWGAGGDLSAGNGTEIQLTTEPAVRALQFMRNQLASGGLYAPNFDTMRENDALAVFASGNAIFMRNWPYAYGELGKVPSLAGKYGVAPLPTFGGKGASAAVGGSNLGVNRFSRNVEAAKQFVEFASTDTQVQVGLGLQSRPPALASAYDDAELAKKTEMKLAGEVLRTARARPPTPEWSSISDEIQQQVFPAYTGRRTPEEAVKAIQSFLKL